MTNRKNTINTDKLSQVAENYLLSLFILSEEGIKATPAHLAEHLKSLPASEGPVSYTHLTLPTKA